MAARVRVLALLPLLVLPLGCAGPTRGDQTRLWQEAPAAAAAPELTRFNDLLADLADRLKPALVHVRVRRGGARGEGDDAPGGAPRAARPGARLRPHRPPLPHPPPPR